MAQLVDLLVDRGIFFDKGIGGGNVGFRLVIVVVGDEIFDGIVGEEFFELTEELGGQSLVRCQHQRGSLHSHNNIGHGEGFARAGNTEQDLVLITTSNPGNQFFDRLWLIALWLVIGL